MIRLSPALAAALLLAATPAAAERVSVLVFDASGSMWNRVEGDLSRIEVARDVIGEYFGTRDGAVPLAVVAYGHNRRGDCSDIEVVSPMGRTAASDLEARLRGLTPRGMTPLTQSLRRARAEIPDTAEAADIILVTDGLETCEGDPCALAAELAAEGIAIRAHVVGFGLTRTEVDALACITEQTGGMLFQTNSGAELADALAQVSVAPEPEPEPEPLEPEPEPAERAAFDIGDKAEAGFTYTIRWSGEALASDSLGFVPRGADRAPSSGGFGPINVMAGGVPRNPVTRVAPTEPGLYDIVIRSARHGVIARQAVEVVAPARGFDPIGSVEPGARVAFTWRGPDQLGERVVVADPDQPVGEFRRHDWTFTLSKRGSHTFRAPTEPGEYEIRYLDARATEVLFSRRFGVGIPFEDADATTTADLAAQAAAATRGAPDQDEMPEVEATFRLPVDPSLGGSVSWDAIPLDPGMSPEAWAPMESGTVVTGRFEAGLWRVTARAPGETVFTADVEIFPSQQNDFTLALVSDDLDGSLAGDYTLWAIPPREIADAPREMARITLALTDERMDYVGRFATTPAMGGPAEGDLTEVREEEGYLFLTLALPQVSDPAVISLAPEGDGFVGTLAIGTTTMPMALWPAGSPPQADAWRDAAFGSAPAAEPDTGIVVLCTEESVCAVTRGRLSANLPRHWGMTEPSFVSATAGQNPIALPRVEFYGPEIGDALYLNPHQWLASNGPCIESQAGPLCMFADAPPGTVAAAVPMALGLRLAEDVGGAVVEDASAFALRADPPPAGTPGFFSVDATAPAGFDGRVVLRAVGSSGEAALFDEAAADWLAGQDQVLPVPGEPGVYELRWYAADGRLVGVTPFEVPAAERRGDLPPSGDGPTGLASGLGNLLGLDAAAIEERVMGAAAEQMVRMAAPVATASTGPRIEISGRIVYRLDGTNGELVTATHHKGELTMPEGTDRAVAEFAAAFSGRSHHGASWTTIDGPILVQLDASEDPSAISDAASIDLRFALDPATLELIAGRRGLAYSPDGRVRNTIEAQSLHIELRSIRTVSDQAFAVAGIFDATFADGRRMTGGFDIDSVTGSRPLQDLLGGTR